MDTHTPDFSDLRGIPHDVMRAVEIAAAGSHSLLLLAPRGLGTTMIAQRITTILPALAPDEVDDVTCIMLASGYPGPGYLPAGPLISRRPFRAPHHTVSVAGLNGARLKNGDVRPGEITLATHGVLLADEITDFSGMCLDALMRNVDKHTTILVGVAAPCLCGAKGSPSRVCACNTRQQNYYSDRLAVLASRFDLVVDCDVGGAWEGGYALKSGAPCESSATIRTRVEAARRRMGGTSTSRDFTVGNMMAVALGGTAGAAVQA